MMSDWSAGYLKRDQTLDLVRAQAGKRGGGPRGLGGWGMRGGAKRAALARRAR
jgi:hypothetical protein